MVLLDTNPSKSRFSFLTRPEYFRDLPKRIAATVKGDSILLCTMVYSPEEPEIQAITDELCKAAQRGVCVEFIVDAYLFLLGRGPRFGPYFFHANLPEKLPPFYEPKREALQKLEAAGVQCTIINKPERVRMNPYAGRSHIKLALINDHVYIGGANLGSVDHLDIVVSREDRKLARYLHDSMDAVVKVRGFKKGLDGKDQCLPINKNTDLLIDAGVPEQSLILDRVLQAIDEAEKSVLITCQYYPNGVVAQHLSKAHNRGVAVSVIYNNPGKMPPPFSLIHYSRLWREQLRSPAALFKDVLPKSHAYLHAKLLATDKVTIVGSHNYVPIGVKFGTAEMALYSTDKTFARMARQTLNKQLSR